MGLFPSKRKICIVYGDFVAREVVRILNFASTFGRHYRVYFIKSVPRPYRRKKRYPLGKIKKCSLFLYQRGFLQFPEFYDLLPPHCKKISFPVLQMRSVWPLEQKDPRYKPRILKCRIWGRFPFGNRAIIQLLSRGMSPREALETFLDTDIGTYVDVEEFHRLNMAAGRDLDARCDLDINRYIEENFCSQQFFWTPRHPTPLLLIYIAQRILRKLEMPSLKLYRDMAVRTIAPMSSLQLPIHPQVIERLNLRWIDEKATYPHFIFGRLNYWEYLERYVKFR